MARLKSATVRAGLVVVGSLLVASCYDNNNYNFTPFWQEDRKSTRLNSSHRL